MQTSPNIVVVDDEVAMVRSLELLLRPLGHVLKAYSVEEVQSLLSKQTKVDCIVTDVSMPEADGLSLLDELNRRHPEIPVIVMTAFSSIPQAVDAMHRGAFQYLVKPFENGEMVETVKRALRKKGVSAGETKGFPKGWICSSSAMKDCLEQAEKSAVSSSPLLLVGELGTGKKRLARWIHEISPRAKKEFLQLDARVHADDQEALEKLQAPARLGTVYVHEAFSFPLVIQHRLNQMIVEEKVKVIGATTLRPELVKGSSVDEGFFLAMSRLSLRVPSLKERLEDFEALTHEFLGGLATRLKARSLVLHPEALRKLRAREFSGNILELERVLERSALGAKGGVITAELIPDRAEDLTDVLPFTIPVEEGWKRLEVLQQGLERELIARALEKYPQSSNSEIAEILGTTRRILELRIKEYGLRES